MGLLDFLGKRVELKDLDTIFAQKTDQLYFKELALYIAISYIANTISKCEIKVYKEGKEVHDELYYALNVNPNPNQNGSQFINKIVERYYRDGHALVVPFNDTRLYCADGFAIDEKPLNDNLFCNIEIETKQIPRKYKASEVFYFKLDNTPVKRLIDGLYGTYAEVMNYAMEAYKRSNGTKYKLILENYKAGDASFNELFEKVIKKQLEAFIKNNNSVYPQFKGTDLQVFGSGSTASSADIIAIRKEIFDTTAQAFKIPQSMMYGNITNMNEIVKVYLSICIDPLADMISEELTRKTNNYATWARGDRVMVDTSCINHIDVLEVADKVDKAISSGVASVDEIRERLSMEPLNTEFSMKHWITKNYTSEETAVNQSDF